MTVEDIYSKISAHMIKGVMMHAQMSDYYNFLGLKGYSKCHEHHFFEEMCNLQKLHNYFLTHHNKLIPELSIQNPKVIPDSWYNYTRQEVGPSTKQMSVKNGLTMWVDWEKETKTLYQQMYKELMEIGEVASACIIKELICDVDKELKKAEGYLLDKETTEYNLGAIINEQKSKHEKYKKKLERHYEHKC